MCRKRAANGEVTELDEIPSGFGIGLPFILEMTRAKVAGNDLSDANRHCVAALYYGLTLGRKRTGEGLPLDSPALETDISL